jgi:cell division protein FtsW
MKSRDPDYSLILLTLLLLGLGLVILFSASSVRGAFTYGSSTYYVKRQFLYGVLPGLALCIFFYILSPRWLKRLAVLMFLLMLGVLATMLIPEFGVTMKGATRWFQVGSLRFQPAEFFKLTFIMYLARFFSLRQQKISNFYEVTLPFFVFLGIAGILLLLQPATGTFGVIILIALAMYFFSGARLRDLSIVLIVLAIAFLLLIFISPYRFERIKTFLDPGRDPRGAGYQITQALIAIGSGGLEGVGFGHSRQKYNFLPEIIGDSIFAIFAEEMGFLGAISLLVVFLLLMYRSIRIALAVTDPFMRLLAVGVATWIVGQAFINIGALTGLLPLTGIPLPFVSYGGSHLAAELAAMGVLFNISRYIK